jgi:hypothetical protein
MIGYRVRQFHIEAKVSDEANYDTTVAVIDDLTLQAKLPLVRGPRGGLYRTILDGDFIARVAVVGEDFIRNQRTVQVSFWARYVAPGRLKGKYA